MYKVAIIRQGKYHGDYQGPSLSLTMQMEYPHRIRTAADRKLARELDVFEYKKVTYWLHRVCKKCSEGQHEIHFFYVDLPTLSDSDCRELLDKGIKTYWRVI